MAGLWLNLLAALSVMGAAPAPAADPAVGPVCEAAWHDAARNRDVPVRIRMPAGTGKVPVILFSHGLGGSLEAGTLWAQAWVRDGEAVIHLQHPGSDSGIFRSGGLRQAMSLTQLENRTGDVRFVIDQLRARQREGACDLTRLDLTRIGMAGHSFGAQTTLSVAGERFPAMLDYAPRDPRIRAAIAFSPQPSMSLGDAQAFGAITIPFLSVTGSEDALPWLNQVTAADRERPFRAMPPGDKYLLVLNGANHGVFSGQARTMLPPGAPVDHIRGVTVQATLQFWRMTLKGDTAAKDALTHLPLASGDRFEQR